MYFPGLSERFPVAQHVARPQCAIRAAVGALQALRAGRDAPGYAARTIRVWIESLSVHFPELSARSPVAQRVQPPRCGVRAAVGAWQVLRAGQRVLGCAARTIQVWTLVLAARCLAIPVRSSAARPQRKVALTCVPVAGNPAFPERSGLQQPAFGALVPVGQRMGRNGRGARACCVIRPAAREAWEEWELGLRPAAAGCAVRDDLWVIAQPTVPGDGV